MMDIWDLLLAMSNKELLCIYGGIGLSATVVNAVLRGVNFTLELGRTLGTIIRRKMDRRLC